MSVSDSGVHRLLVNALASSIAWDHGVVERADGFGTLQPPDALGGQRPDLVAVSSDGAIVIGEAKTAAGAGAVSFDDSLQAFKEWADDQDETVVRLALAVPSGFGSQAADAAGRAGWSEEKVEVVEVDVGISAEGDLLRSDR
jgi:hypothetical protein